MTPTPQSATTEETAGGTLPAAAEQAQEKVREGAQAAREQAQGATREARERARRQLDDRTTQAGDRIKGSAGDARSMAEHLRAEGRDGPARMVEEAADRAEGLGGYLSEADADRLLRDAEGFARRNPWAVIAGGLVAGFAASRVLSASSASRSAVGEPRPRQQLPAPTRPPVRTEPGSLMMPEPTPDGYRTEAPHTALGGVPR